MCPLAPDSKRDNTGPHENCGDSARGRAVRDTETFRNQHRWAPSRIRYEPYSSDESKGKRKRESNASKHISVIAAKILLLVGNTLEEVDFSTAESRAKQEWGTKGLIKIWNLTNFPRAKI